MPLKTKDIRGVQLLRPGTWNDKPFPLKMLEQIVDAYNKTKHRLAIPIKLGHDDEQKLLQEDGYPSAGWVRNLRLVKDRFIADLIAIPLKIAELIEAGGYHKVSVEVNPDFTINGQKYPWVLTGLAILGGNLPAVDSLTGITALYESLQLTLEAGTEPIYLEIETKEVEQESPPDDNREIDNILAESRFIHQRAERILRGKHGSKRVRALHETYLRELDRVCRRRMASILLRMDFEKWTRASIDDLPDSCFAVIQQGGEKDSEGKTTPRSLRRLPYKNASGKVDLPHLRNALARISQTKGLSTIEKSRAMAKLQVAAKDAGVGREAKAVNYALRIAREELEELKLSAVAKALGLSATASSSEILAEADRVRRLAQSQRFSEEEEEMDESADLAKKVIHDHRHDEEHCEDEHMGGGEHKAAGISRGRHEHSMADMKDKHPDYDGDEDDVVGGEGDDDRKLDESEEEGKREMGGPGSGRRPYGKAGRGGRGRSAAPSSGKPVRHALEEEETEHRMSHDPEVTELRKLVLKMQGKEASKEAEARVDLAMAEGRLLPVQRAVALKIALGTPEVFEEFIKNQPKVIKFGAVGFTGGSGNSSLPNMSTFEPTELELTVRRSLFPGEDEMELRLSLIKAKAKDAGVRLPADFKLEAPTAAR